MYAGYGGQTAKPNPLGDHRMDTATRGSYGMRSVNSPTGVVFVPVWARRFTTDGPIVACKVYQAREGSR